MITLLEKIRQTLEVPVIRVGQSEVSLWSIVSVLGMVTLLFWGASVFRRVLVTRVLARTGLELGVREAVGSMARYVVLLLGAAGILQTAGLDLTALSVFAGAIGIGLGLGLQNITNNFVSGLIILLERPIKVGDRIEVGGIDGDVMEIGGRSTRIQTNDNITIIVPNSRFVSENVINWKYSDSIVRFRIPIGVAYHSDPRDIERILLDVARANPDVLQEPPPQVWLRSFGDNAINFELLAWNRTLVHRKGKLVSDLNRAIYEAFEKHRVEIPFPQRVVHLPGPPPETSGTPT